jgi:hypothetical protein
MSRHAGISASSAQRIWSKNDLKPHRVKTFKLSNDPKFEVKFWDVIGLYLGPPGKALVLCCDENRPMPSARMRAAWASARTQTYTHGDARLYAAWHNHVVCSPRPIDG